MTESRDNLESAPVSSGALLIFSVRLACLGLIIYWTLFLLRPFLGIALWSIVFTVALYPVFGYLTTIMHGRQKLAAATITVTSLLIILGPASWLGLSLAHSVRSLVEQFGSGDLAIPAPSDAIRTWPLIGDEVYRFWQLASTNLAELISEIAPQLKPLGSRLLRAAGSVGLNLLKFIVAIVISGFLFIPGKDLAIAAKTMLSRVVTKRGEEFVDLAGATIRNVSRGVIGIAFLQALLAGIGLLVVKVPAAGLLSLLAFILGILQIGPSIILIPTVIWVWFVDDTTTAVLFTLYILPVSLLDNILRPIVMAQGLNVPMLVILLGVIGGTIAHGLIGLFIGPIILAIAWQLLAALTRDDAGAS